MNWLDFIAVLFAAGAVIDVWHKGSVFASLRAYAQALQDVTPHNTLKGYFLEWVNCPFCKSYHIPFYLYLCLLAGDWLSATIGLLVRVVIYSLAATRIGNIINDLLPNHAKYSPDPFSE
jgi:hypothetical protein